MTSKAHPVVKRHGDDLVREEVDLGAGSLEEAYFSANLSGLNGRQQEPHRA